MAYATGKKAGSLGQTLANIKQSVKNVFVPKSEKAEYNLGTYSSSTGTYSGGTATSGSSTSHAPNVVTSSGSGGGSSNYVSGGSSGSSSTPTPTEITKPKVEIKKNVISQVVQKIKKPSETYDPRLMAYVSSTQRSGSVTIRPPTYEERIKMETASSRVEEKVFGKNRQENILTADISKINRDIEKLNELSNTLIKKEKELKNVEQINENGEWTGSERELIEYNDKINKFNSDLNKYNQIKDINVGVFGQTTKRDIREFDLKRKPITSTFKIISATGGSTAGGLTTKIIGKDREITLSKLDVYKSGQGTIQTNPLTGENIIFKDTYKMSLTGEEAGKIVGKGTEFGLDIGKYAIPVLGTGVFVGETRESIKESGSFGKYVTEKPLEAGLTLGIGTVMVSRPVKGIFSDVIIKDGKVTTPAMEFFGKKVRISKEGIKIFPSERYLAKVETQKIGVGQFGESFKPTEFSIVQPKPETRILKDNKVITKIDDITGFGRQIEEGEKTIIKIPEPKTIFERKVRISKEGIKLIPKDKPLFSGLSPYTKEGQLERKEVVKYFKKLGIGEKETKELIRYKQPKILESKFKGSGLIIDSEEGSKLLVSGQLRETFVKAEAQDIFGKVNTRLGGKGKIEYIKLEAKPLKDVKDIEIFKGTKESRTALLTREGLPYSELSSAGKTREVSEFVSGTKKLGEIEVPKEIKVFEDIKQFQTKQFELYGETSLSKRVIPIKRKTTLSGTKVSIEKGEPNIIVDLNEMFGVKRQIGFTGGDKKSSIQYLQSLYKQDLSPVLTKIEPKKLKSSELLKQPSIKFESVTPPELETRAYGISKFAGTGQYERTDNLGLMTLGTRGESKLELNQLVNVRTKEVNKFVTSPVIKTKEGQKNIISPIVKEKVKEESKQKEEQIQKVEETLKLGQLLKQKQQQSFKFKNLLRQEQQQQNVRPITPKPLKIPFAVKGRGTDFVPKIKESEEEFELFGKRYGKFDIIGKAKTKQEAGKKVKDWLKSGLGRSSYIEKGGKKLKFGEFSFGREFRPSKKSKDIIVQESWASLGTRGETSEIQRERKLKGKNKRNNLFW